MNGLLTEQFEIAAVLDRHVGELRESTPGGWSFVLGDRVGTARLEAEWLLLDIPLVAWRSTSTVAGDSLAATLPIASTIGGLAKFGFDPSGRRLHLQAEVPLVLEDDPMLRIDLAFCSLEEALERLQTAAACAPAERPAVDEEMLKRRCARWKDLCDESGWPVHQRGQSRLAVSLDVPGSFCQAIVEADGPDRLRIRHEAGKNELSAAGRRAISLFLLTASRVVRMVRAYGEGMGTGGLGLEKASPAPSLQAPVPSSYGWEVALSDPPAPFEFDRALAALSMACRMSTNELAVLTDDEVSRRYLAVQGMVL